MDFSEKYLDKGHNKTKSSLNKIKKTFSCSDIISEEFDIKRNLVQKKTKIHKNINNINYKYNDSRFDNFLNTFEQKYNELYDPFEYLLNNKKIKLKKFPLINKNH